MWQRLLLIAGGWYLMKELLSDKQAVEPYSYYFLINGTLLKKEKSTDGNFHFYIKNPNPPHQFVPLEFLIELDYFARLIYCEARGEPSVCKELVASVVINRLTNKCWHNLNINKRYKTVLDVIFEPNQFACTTSRVFYDYKNEIRKNKYELNAFIDSLRIAIKYLYNTPPIIITSLLYFGTYNNRNNPNLIPFNFNPITNITTLCQNKFYLDKRCLNI